MRIGNIKIGWLLARYLWRKKVNSHLKTSLQERIYRLRDRLQKQSSLVSEEWGNREYCLLLNQTQFTNFSKYPFNNFSKSR